MFTQALIHPQKTQMIAEEIVSNLRKSAKSADKISQKYTAKILAKILLDTLWY